jgi:hypothetical protein
LNGGTFDTIFCSRQIFLFGCPKPTNCGGGRCWHISIQSIQFGIILQADKILLSYRNLHLTPIDTYFNVCLLLVKWADRHAAAHQPVHNCVLQTPPESLEVFLDRLKISGYVVFIETISQWSDNYLKKLHFEFIYDLLRFYESLSRNYTKMYFKILKFPVRPSVFLPSNLFYGVHLPNDTLSFETHCFRLSQKRTLLFQ